MTKVQILKTKENKFLIGLGGKHKDGIRLNAPFEIKKSAEGVVITPYDVDIIDTYIPYIDFEEYEYVLEPEKALADFYKIKSEAFIIEVKARILSGETPTERTKEPKEPKETKDG